MFGTIIIGLVLVICVVLYIFEKVSRKKFLQNLSDRYVLITGCDTGFGNHLAKRLDKLGVPVFACCLTDTGASDLSRQGSSRLKTLILDVTREDHIKAAVKFVQENIPDGRDLWGVVSNAGICKSEEPVELLSKSQLDETFAVNLFGAINVTKAFLPLLRKSNGRLVIVSSVLVYVPIPCRSAYCMSKAALESFAVCLRRELYLTPVTVHTVKPGGFMTNVYCPDLIFSQLKDSFESASDEVKKAYGQRWLQSKKETMFNLLKELASDFSPVTRDITHALFSVRPRCNYNSGQDAKWKYYPMSLVPARFADWYFHMPAPDYVNHRG